MVYPICILFDMFRKLCVLLVVSICGLSSMLYRLSQIYYDFNYGDACIQKNTSTYVMLCFQSSHLRTKQPT